MNHTAHPSRSLNSARSDAQIQALYQKVLDLKTLIHELEQSERTSNQTLRRIAIQKLRSVNADLRHLAGKLGITLSAI